MGELILIAVVALLAVGPDRLPQAARSLGRGIRDIRRQTDDLQQTIEQDSELGDAVRELRSAWYSTNRALPRNRHDLGRRIDEMTRSESGADAKPESSGEHTAAPLPEGSGSGDAGDAPAQPEAGASHESAQDPEVLPRLAPPAGTVARGAAPARPGNAPADRAPKEPERGQEQGPADPDKPAHG